jgi:hypothetical protein
MYSNEQTAAARCVHLGLVTARSIAAVAKGAAAEPFVELLDVSVRQRTEMRWIFRVLFRRVKEPCVRGLGSSELTWPSTFEVKPMRAAATTSPGSEFQNFLYAPICQDQEGMTLSVLSALARRDVDPWTEAARLSRLPKEMATKQITDLLDGLPLRTLACLNRVEVAARLSALLPRDAGLTISGKQPQPVSSFNWRFFYIYLCSMLLMNWLMAEFRAQTASGTPPAAVTKAPETHSL